MSGITKKELRKKLVLHKEVETYLRKRKVLTAFKRNCIDQWHEQITISGLMFKDKDKYLLNPFNKLTAESTRERLVIRAFIWRHTPEGYDFWFDVCYDK